MSDKRKPKGWLDDERLLVPDLHVYEPEEPRETGLLDHSGRKLVRETRRIGFLPSRPRSR
jgi:hypothetical protein